MNFESKLLLTAFFYFFYLTTVVSLCEVFNRKLANNGRYERNVKYQVGFNMLFNLVVTLPLIYFLHSMPEKYGESQYILITAIMMQWITHMVAPLLSATYPKCKDKKNTLGIVSLKIAYHVIHRFPTALVRSSFAPIIFRLWAYITIRDKKVELIKMGYTGKEIKEVIKKKEEYRFPFDYENDEVLNKWFGICGYHTNNPFNATIYGEKATMKAYHLGAISVALDYLKQEKLNSLKIS